MHIKYRQLVKKYVLLLCSTLVRELNYLYCWSSYDKISMFSSSKDYFCVGVHSFVDVTSARHSTLPIASPMVIRIFGFMPHGF
jgi:hypothetical protein